MSAFQVSSDHIGAIVRWYLTACPQPFTRWRGLQPCYADGPEMMAELAHENYRSVLYRYPTGPLPGPLDSNNQPVVCDEPLSRYKRLMPVEVIKACHCLNYQSCEHPEWPDSEAKKLLDDIEAAAISQLPGYRDAPWSIDELENAEVNS